jgi:hypothetical protein
MSKTAEYRLRWLERYRVEVPVFAGYIREGFNGTFVIPIEGVDFFVIADDGTSNGWKHISVSNRRDKRKIPSWTVMCRVKDLFFGPEEVAVQFHPKESEYVNVHPGVLHLWGLTGAEFPAPEWVMV